MIISKTKKMSNYIMFDDNNYLYYEFNSAVNNWSLFIKYFLDNLKNSKKVVINGVTINKDDFKSNLKYYYQVCSSLIKQGIDYGDYPSFLFIDYKSPLVAELISSYNSDDPNEIEENISFLKDIDKVVCNIITDCCSSYTFLFPSVASNIKALCEEKNKLTGKYFIEETQYNYEYCKKLLNYYYDIATESTNTKSNINSFILLLNCRLVDASIRNHIQLEVKDLYKYYYKEKIILSDSEFKSIASLGKNYIVCIKSIIDNFPKYNKNNDESKNIADQLTLNLFSTYFKYVDSDIISELLNYIYDGKKDYALLDIINKYLKTDNLSAIVYGEKSKTICRSLELSNIDDDSVKDLFDKLTDNVRYSDSVLVALLYNSNNTDKIKTYVKNKINLKKCDDVVLEIAYIYFKISKCANVYTFKNYIKITINNFIKKDNKQKLKDECRYANEFDFVCTLLTDEIKLNTMCYCLMSIYKDDNDISTKVPEFSEEMFGKIVDLYSMRIYKSTKYFKRKLIKIFNDYLYSKKYYGGADMKTIVSIVYNSLNKSYLSEDDIFDILCKQESKSYTLTAREYQDIVNNIKCCRPSITQMAVEASLGF